MGRTEKMNSNEGQDHSSAILAPSLLAGDHAMLAVSAAQIRDTGLQWAHLDIMDGHFVPNLTFGPQLLRDIRKHVPSLFYDVHLMLDNPDHFTQAFIEAGAGLVSMHLEAPINHRAELEKIHILGAKCGIVLNPETPAESVFHLLDIADLVLVMTVHPGRGGQPFLADMLPKIRAISSRIREMGTSTLLEVDGGVDIRTAPLCLDAGANVLVAGTAFFNSDDKSLFTRKILARKTDSLNNAASL